MEERRLYTYEKIKSDFQLNGNAYLALDSEGWKRPRVTTLENLNGFINIKITEDIKEKNVTSVEYFDQNINPTIPPNTYKVNLKTHIAVDNNYLYVWVPKLNRWKRMLLSEW